MTNVVVLRHPIESAPRDGRAVWISHEDCGEFLMAWQGTAKNGLFPDQIGFWVDATGNNPAFTWNEADGMGPSHWRPYVEG